MLDYHTHSNASFDAQYSVRDMARAAAQRGIEEICITDHADLDPVVEKVGAPFDPQKYEAGFAPGGFDVRVRRGLELGAYLPRIDDMRAAAHSCDFDFILLSQHYIPGIGDPYFPSFFEGRSRDECYRAYLSETAASLAAYDDFDVLGHLGYVTKYYPGEDKVMTYGDYPELIDGILRRLIELGKGLELNTAGYEVHGGALPDISIVKRYIELGGEIVTLGSDAHRPEQLGRSFERAAQELRAAGLKRICGFRSRKPVYFEL